MAFKCCFYGGLTLYKVLIADDFIVDRENLRDMVGSLKDLAIEITAVCENGVEALEQMAICRPDIVISDIEMPFMDGFELARRIKRDYPGVRIIFCSLYNDFEYARKALYLDSYGYVLKPIDPAELQECILKVMGSISVETEHEREYTHLKEVLQRNKPVLVENFIKDLLYGLTRSEKDIKERADFLNLEFEEGVFILTLLEIDDYPKITGQLTIESRQILSLRIFEQVKETVGNYRKLLLVKLDDSHFIMIHHYSDAVEPEKCHLAVTEICGKVLGEFRKSDVSLSMSVSGHCQSIMELNNLYEQCSYNIRYKYSLGKGIVIYNKDVSSGNITPDIDFNRMQKEVRFLLNSGSEDEIDVYINSLFDNKSISSGEQYLKNLCFELIICIQIVLHENKESFKPIFNDEKLVWEKLLDFETILDTRNWIKNLFVFTNQYLAKKAMNKNMMIAEEVKKYIEKNYSKNPSLEAIAADLFYSPDYLNLLFKQVMGETIFDHMCRYKVEKAKEMLVDTKLKLYEIAEALGYSHTAYFSSFFKRFTGLTPKEYRERCIQ